MRSQLFALVALGPLTAYALPKYQRKCGKPRPSTTSSAIVVTTGLPLSDFPGFSTAPVESLPVVTTYSTDSITPSATPEATTVTTGLPLSDFPGFSTAPVESLPVVTTYSTDFPTPSATPAATTVTTGLPLTDFPGFTYAPPESLPTVTTYSTDSIISSAEPLSTTVTTGLPLTDFPGFTYAPPESITAATTFSTDSITPTATASLVVDAAYSDATPISYKVAPKVQCGNDDRLILPGMPWTVANSMYNADSMVGEQCTNFEGILQSSDGTKVVKWTSTTDVDFVEDTKGLCKGYTNIGIGVNLNHKLKDIKSIPAYYQWDRTNTTAFRGSNVFDFITAPTKGDYSSTATSEFMLWIRNWGNQIPIGYARGPVATFDLFGASWKLYEGKNPTNGVTVRSMLVDENFDGVFQGDLKEWLDIMVKRGYISDNDYLTVGNAGTEIFYGKAVMHAVVGLDIKV